MQPRPTQDSASVSLILSLVGGLFLVFLVPPFQGPDEPAHFFRALSLAGGTIQPEGGFTQEFPAESLRLYDQFSRLAAHAEAKTSFAELREAARHQAGEALRQASFPTTAVYPPIPYLPSASGIALVRPFTDSPLLWLWAARLVSMAASTILIAFAIRFAGEWGWFLMLLAATPMALFLRSTCTADSLTFAAGFFFVGLLLRQSPTAPRSQSVLLVLTALVLALCKPPYGGLALLALALPVSRFRSARHRLVIQGAVLAAATAGFCLTSWIATRGLSGSEQSTILSSQLRFAQEHPVKTVSIVLHDLVIHTPRYLAHFVGRLGWLDAPVPPIYVVAFLLLAIFVFTSTLRSSEMLATRHVATILTVMTGLAFTIGLSLFLTWTPPGTNSVEGVQGRYFLPIAPAIALIANVKQPISRGSAWLASGGAAAAAVTTLITVYLRYFA
jgi:uncharacterized membrane protein